MKVFISYAHSDQAMARQLAEAMRKEGLDVWVADSEIFPGDNYAEKTGQALNESEAMVALLTEQVPPSRHMLHEIQFALGAYNYRQRLIPLLVGSPEEIPWILRRLNPIRINHPGELQQAAKKIAQTLQATIDLRRLEPSS